MPAQSKSHNHRVVRGFWLVHTTRNNRTSASGLYKIFLTGGVTDYPHFLIRLCGLVVYSAWYPSIFVGIAVDRGSTKGKKYLRQTGGYTRIGAYQCSPIRYERVHAFVVFFRAIGGCCSKRNNEVACERIFPGGFAMSGDDGKEDRTITVTVLRSSSAENEEVWTDLP